MCIADVAYYNLCVGNKFHGIFNLCDRQYDRQLQYVVDGGEWPILDIEIGGLHFRWPLVFTQGGANQVFQFFLWRKNISAKGDHVPMPPKNATGGGEMLFFFMSLSVLAGILLERIFERDSEQFEFFRWLLVGGWQGNPRRLLFLISIISKVRSAVNRVCLIVLLIGFDLLTSKMG